MQSMSKKLALLDIDGTVKEPIQGKFSQPWYNQKIIKSMYAVVKELRRQNYLIYGVSNQGGIEAGYKTLSQTIKEMRYTLHLCPEIERIYFAKNNLDAWVVTNKFTILDVLPTWINTVSRYKIKMPDDKMLGNGFRKPNSGMLLYAIADWFNKYDLSDGLITGSELVSDRKNLETMLLSKEIFMSGDRPEDKQAADNYKIPFIQAKDLQNWDLKMDLVGLVQVNAV